MTVIKKRILQMLMFILTIGAIGIGVFIVESRNVSAATVTVKQKNVYSNKVTLIVKGDNLSDVLFQGVWLEGESVEKLERKSFRRKNGHWEVSLTLKEYGKYSFDIEGYEGEYDDYFELSESVTYKSNFTGVEIGNNGKTTKKDFESGDKFFVYKNGKMITGKEIYARRTDKIQTKVIYHASFKGTIVGDVGAVWGSKSINGVEEILTGSDKDKGTGQKFYYSIMTYNINTVLDYEGVIKVHDTSSTKSLGITVKVDGTKPKITIAPEFAKGKTKYTNKTTSVPVTIEEKNFDSGNTIVLINGKRTSVSWSGSGSVQKANVPLHEGKNVIEVRSKDKAGNDAQPVKSAEIIVDKKAPKVKIVGFGNGTGKGLKNGQVVKYPLKVVISDETKIGNASVKLYRVDANGKGKSELPLDIDQNGNKVTYSLEDIDEDGYYELSISVKDRAGNNPTTKTVISEGKKPYKLSGRKITGGFTVNRKGSMYKLEDESIFQRPVKPINEVVVYEYNKSELKKHTVLIINSRSVTPIVLSDKDYRFEKVKSDSSEYDYKYKYTIYGSVLNEGRNNIEITSETIAGKNGNTIAQIVESNSINKAIVIDNEAPQILYFRINESGNVSALVRDRYIDKNNIYVQIGAKKYNLKINESMSTSTNMVFTGDIKGSPSEAKMICSDLAGNTTESTDVEVQKNSMASKILLYGGIIFGVILVIIGTLVVVIIIRKKE